MAGSLRWVPIMRNVCVAVFAGALACAGSIGCASKGFVRESVGAANDNIESLIDALEETQERNQRNEQRIEQVDSKLGTIEKSTHDTLGVASRAAGAAKAADAKLIRFKIDTDETWRKANRSRAKYVFNFGDLCDWYRKRQRRPEVQVKKWARRHTPSPLV